MNGAAKLHPQFVTDAQGRRKAVLLPLEEYEELLEDLADLAVVVERRGEDTVPHEGLKEELRSDGFLGKP